MFSQGPFIATSGSDGSSFGSSSWVNPSRITADDGSVTSNTNLAGTYDTHYLVSTNFGFSIPKNAVILGIEAIFGDRQYIASGTGTHTDGRIRLIISGTVQSTDRASGAVWPDIAETKTFGSPSDTWGRAWAPSEINDTSFGCVLSVHQVLSSTSNSLVDYVSMKIYYDLPGDFGSAI